MANYVVMLRGVNVGKTQLRMEALRDLCVGIGAVAPRTYIQSGNVVFKHGASPAKLRKAVQAALERSLGLSLEVIVRTAHDLKTIQANNPYLKRQLALEHLYVTFLNEAVPTDRLHALSTEPVDGDEFIVGGKEIFLYCPGGYGKTKLSNSFFEKRLGIAATTRNWRTVTKLCELVDS